MPTMPRSGTKECVYCGRKDDLTVEHAPPLLIFPKPRPSNLITVPACRKCNSQGSKDAEYFRLCLCLNEQTNKSPSAQILKPSVFKSLHRKQAKGLRAGF